MTKPGAVKTILRCERCRNELHPCVPVRIGVPQWLACDHDSHGTASGGGGSSGGLACPRCSCDWQLRLDRLTGVVEDLLRGRHDEWRRAGAVVVRCG